MPNEILVQEKKCLLFGDETASLRLIQLVDDYDLSGMDSQTQRMTSLCPDKKWLLIAVPVNSWNSDLSPWDAPPVYGKDGFGHGAAETLQWLTNALIPYLEDAYGTGDRYVLGGYSLAGLFALWAGYQTTAFSGIAAASPSVWFPGWMEYVQARSPKAKAVYLSLGDREERTRNPVMAAVGDCIRSLHGLLCAQGVITALEWNEGNHFKEPDARTAKAFAWVMNQL